MEKINLNWFFIEINFTFEFMYKLENELNYGFNIFDENNEVFDKISGPGDPGSWLSQPDSPDVVAFFPIPITDAINFINKSLCYRVQRFKLDSSKLEIIGTSEEFSACVINSMNDAFDLAEKLKVNFFYFSEWDFERTTIILDSKGSRDPYITKDYIYYTNEY